MNTGFGLADNLKYNEFVFDSALAKSGSGGAAVSDWPIFFPGKPINNVAALKILEVQIPFSYYVFNETNNQFFLQESPTSFASTLTVTIPPGNYTADNFMVVLGNAMTNASANSGGSNVIYTASFDFPSSKITIITLNTTPGYSFRLYMKDPAVAQEPSNLQPGPFIGFNDGKLYTSSTTSYATTVTALGTTVLTAASSRYQVFIGTLTQTVTLPVLATLVPGDTFYFYNTSADTVFVQNSAAVPVYAQVTATYVTYSVSGAGTQWVVGNVADYTGGAIPAEAQSNLQAENVMKLSGPNYLYLCSTALGPLVKLFLPNESLNGYPLGSTGPEVSKIPIEVNSGNMIYWQDPDSGKWFDMDNMQSFPKIDFYCSFGTNNETGPINFNGQGFSIKMGVLLADANVSTMVGGGAGNNRVATRSWQPSSMF